ncbi:helix-turn-helix transcriptional regulator [Candidatus Poriferisocius sp.]|uniref:helix-turn-helix transcriptional regulator n=1 Tax=Candidatus Poriferisocius sp. TaxID=3101276 RepID=UPI003B0222EA
MDHRSPQVIRPAEAAVWLGISQATLWRWARGHGHSDFPRPLRLSPGVTVWRIADLEAWLERRAETADRDLGSRRRNYPDSAFPEEEVCR